MGGLVSVQGSMSRRLLFKCFSVIIMVASLTEASAQDGPADSVKVEGGSFIMVGDTVIITFELIAPADALFEVAVVLKRISDPALSITLSSVTGAIGKVRGGGEKAVFWSYKKDVPATFEYALDYWFEVTATPFEEGSVLKWWHYTAAGVGILATSIILSGRSGGEETLLDNRLPGPPGIRPTK